MIHINKKSPIQDNFLVFEFKIDDYIPVSFIKDESNYLQMKDASRNGFSFDMMHSAEIKPLLDSFSDENLYKIIDEIYESNKFIFEMSWILNSNKYGSMYDFIKKITHITTHIFMDRPGMNFAPHFDNRIVFANAVLIITWFGVIPWRYCELISIHPHKEAALIEDHRPQRA